MAALLLATAGCRSTGGEPTLASPPSSASAAPAPASGAAWWRDAGDPLLTALIEDGLAASPEVSCRVAALRRYDLETARDARRIVSRLGRLLGDKDGQTNPAAREERVERIATRRLVLARQIAFAYVEVRRLQQDVARREALRGQYQDNAEVAQFRREAGLVSAIDGSLARSQDETARGELGFAQGRLDAAMAELARLVGAAPDALAARLGSPGTLPDPPLDPLETATPGDGGRATLAEAVLREARLTQALGEARRTARDARIAYREGAGSFAMLYVAEAAALAVELALVDARAGRVTAALNLWSAHEGAWAREGLDPIVPDPHASAEIITVTAGCD
ncbi:outer membrane factor lipoprotein domain-containing protein [Novosphingobium soli]|uniref:RND transporter n=2 Tax=Novosphingobium soli TaxID=574956 RepID=A0ABV6D136_9SPHN